MALGVSTYEHTEATLELSTGFLLGLQPDTNQVVTGLDGWVNGAPMRRPKTNRQGAHGNFAERGWKDERIVSVSGAFFGSSRAEAAHYTDLINAFLADGTGGTLTVSDLDLGTRFARVFLDGTPEVNWNGGTVVRFAIDMATPDPRKYGSQSSGQTGPPEDGGGLVYDLGTSVSAPGILDYGDPGSTGIVEVFNLGTADAPPLAFRVAGYTSGFTITELNTGRRLVYTGVVPNGSELVIDPHDGTAKLDGADRGQQLTVREWASTPANGSSRYLFESNGVNSLLTVEGVSAWW